MVDCVSDVKSEPSDSSSGSDRAASPVEGCGPSQNHETVIVSDESYYSGVTNEDDEDDDDDTEWPPIKEEEEEEELISIKEEQLSADEGAYIADLLPAEDLLPVKEEFFSEASTSYLEGFDGPPAKRRRGSRDVVDELDDGSGCGVRVQEENRNGVRELEQDGGGWGEVKVEASDWVSGFVETFLNPPSRKCLDLPGRTTKLFHCYYCPQWFRMKAYLPRHVATHVRNGDGKYEATECGLTAHPAYFDGTVWPRCQNQRNRGYRHSTWWGKKAYEKYHCYYCPVEFRIKPFLIKHVRQHMDKGHPKFEVVDPSTGEKIHPAYLKVPETVPSREIDNLPHNYPYKEIYACHLCTLKTRHRAVFKSHLKRHAMKARMPDKLTCFHCGFTFKWKRKLEFHMRRHFPGDIECTLCVHRTHTEEQMKRHMRRHTNEKPFACHLCDERFTQNYMLKRHLCTHRFRNNQCSQCAFSATEVGALMEHMMSAHAGPKNYACPDCGFEAAEVPLLRAHALSMHSRKLAKVKCRFCDFEAGSTMTLMKHEKSHTMPEGYLCDECAYVTKNKTSLKSHKMTHSGEKPFKCDLCDYRSASRGCVSRHMVTHSDVRTFKCVLCEPARHFKTQQSLRDHQMYTHRTETKRHPCGACDYVGISLAALKSHEMSHSDDRPYACPECDYRAKLRSNLKNHMKTHAGDRPHKCDYCGFRSRHATGVTVHILNVHPSEKPYACGYCSAAFRLKPELVDHEREHTGEKKRRRRSGLVYKKHKCRFCDFECIKFSKIESHYKESHPEEMKTQVIPELAERLSKYPYVRQHKPRTKRKCRFCPFESTIRRKVRLHEQTHTYEMMGRIDDRVMKM